MSRKRRRNNRLNSVGTLIGIAASLVTIVGFFERVTCPCDGQPLNLLGDKSLFGSRFCKTCLHAH